MTTTSNIRDSDIKILVVVATVIGFGSGYWNGHESMKHECASIMTAGVPIPPAPVVYLSRGE